jgi:hypothetical protein
MGTALQEDIQDRGTEDPHAFRLAPVTALMKQMQVQLRFTIGRKNA